MYAPVPANNYNAPNTRLGRRWRVATRRGFYNAVGGVLWLALTEKSHNLKMQGFGAYAKNENKR